MTAIPFIEEVDCSSVSYGPENLVPFLNGVTFQGLPVVDYGRHNSCATLILFSRARVWIDRRLVPQTRAGRHRAGRSICRRRAATCSILDNAATRLSFTVMGGKTMAETSPKGPRWWFGLSTSASAKKRSFGHWQEFARSKSRKRSTRSHIRGRGQLGCSEYQDFQL